MSGHDEFPVALERLVALGQSPDVNIRPVLLRVVVDMFVHKAHHAPADLKQFEVIVSHLLDNADAEARLVVAEKLARHSATPPALLERFIADRESIAAKVYAHASLDESTLTDAAAWSPAEIALAVAGRTDLPTGTIAALADRPEPAISRQLAANGSAVLDRPIFQQLVRRAKADTALARLLAGRAADPIDLAPLFPIVGPEQRQAVIEAARRLELGRRQWKRLDGATAETLAHMDRLMLRGDREAFETALAAALGTDGQVLGALLNEDSGEILALALAAVGASPEQAARVFIVGDPRIGRSVARVRALTHIVETVSTHAARRLIGAITGGLDEAPRRPAAGSAKVNGTTRRAEPGSLAETSPQQRRDLLPPRPGRRQA